MPDRLSEVVIKRVAVSKRSDGGRALDVTVTSETAGNMFHYYIIADELGGTYRAFAVGDDPFDHPSVRAYLLDRRLELRRSGQWPRYEALLERATGQPAKGTMGALQTFMSTETEPPPNCTQCQSTCNGNGFSRAITWDPAPVDLTHTDMTLRWSRDDTPFGCKWNARGQNSCWAASPVPLPWPFNTNWYVDQCGQRPIEKSEMYALGEAEGGFHNDDFGDPLSRTLVLNNAIVVFNGGQVVHGFVFYAWGEAYYLLDGSVAGASYNNCY